MPRKPRLFVSGATYHVYCRVARGEFVFDDRNEAAEFIEIVRKVRDLDSWHILAFCLMASHYHIVVLNGSASMPCGPRVQSPAAISWSPLAEPLPGANN